MSKSIRSYPNVQRPEVIARRLKQKTFGLGYWAAVESQGRPAVFVEALELAKKLRKHDSRSH